MSCKKDDTPSAAVVVTPVVENSEGLLAVYKVFSTGELEIIKDVYPTNSVINESYQQDSAKHLEMWNLVKDIFPEYYLNSLSTLHIFSAVASESQYTAYVDYNDNDRSNMTLGLAVDFAYFNLFDAQKYFTTTIIHELGHVISFNQDQFNLLPYKFEIGHCDYPFGNEIECLKDDAYLRLFMSEFWSTDLFIDLDEKDIDTFYNIHTEKFLNIYSATGPDEDFAETFKQFIIRDAAPTGSTVPEQKIKLLHSIAELVELRSTLRDKLSDNGSLFISSVYQ